MIVRCTSGAVLVLVLLALGRDSLPLVASQEKDAPQKKRHDPEKELAALKATVKELAEANRKLAEQLDRLAREHERLKAAFAKETEQAIKGRVARIEVTERAVLSANRRDLRFFVATGSTAQPVACLADCRDFPLPTAIFAKAGSHAGRNGVHVHVVFPGPATKGVVAVNIFQAAMAPGDLAVIPVK